MFGVPVMVGAVLIELAEEDEEDALDELPAELDAELAAEEEEKEEEEKEDALDVVDEADEDTLLGAAVPTAEEVPLLSELPPPQPTSTALDSANIVQRTNSVLRIVVTIADSPNPGHGRSCRKSASSLRCVAISIQV